MTRRNAKGLEVGAEITLSDLQIEIEAVNPEGWPTQVRFTFDAVLEAEKWVWLRWDHGEWVPYRLPAVGQSDLIAPADDWAQYRWDAKRWEPAPN
jgi:hypothetical protein